MESRSRGGLPFARVKPSRDVDMVFRATAVAPQRTTNPQIKAAAAPFRTVRSRANQLPDVPTAS
jgi:hypothetical protein